VLTPDLLKILAQMGHDDAVVLADANFTAHRLAAGKPVIHLPGLSMSRVVQAVSSVLPLAEDVPQPVAFMQVGGTEAPYRSALQREVMQWLAANMLATQTAEALERFAFYERVKSAFAIVLTGEKQPWGNFILRKGVIGETLLP
jgi:L-fucose mutarotase